MGTLIKETDLKMIIADGAYVSDNVRNECERENVEFIATAIRGKENEKELDLLSFTLCKLRPPVESLMEKLKPKYLRGRTLFRGRVKVGQRMIMRAIGINFRRYAAYISDFFKNLLLLSESKSQLTNFSHFSFYY